MLPKVRQALGEAFATKASMQRNSDRIDANRGIGTSSALSNSDVTIAKNPGASAAFKKMGNVTADMKPGRARRYEKGPY